MQDFEKPGIFYLGKSYDLDAGKLHDDLLLYESKDLTTHAVCVGMTGSGKTGLCLALLEEAAIDGVPAIVIDPKGDLGNLLLTFPQLRPEDFKPWVDPAEATRKGLSVDDYAAKTAKTWKDGLAEWGEDGARIQRFKDAVDIAIYTPGSNAGLPLTVLKSFDAPAQAVIDNAESMRERVGASVSGLLALLGIDADPLRSREHILLSNILDNAWRESRDVDMAALIQEIQKPPFEKIGVVDLESFFPAKERFALAMSLNNLLASPGFSVWMEGDPLDIQRLLYTAENKPRLSVISIAHLSDSERMFFLTILLGEMIAWMRSQSGTSSLRAMLYMDEVFGYFPPSANPPTKTPMLTLLKQARAFGLGIVLATQNPVDLDYKGLSNAGTWFLGRLQTERDKARVLDGLEGASTAAGAKFDRARMEKILSGLGNRVFLMNNVHEDQPVVFQSRWALSYLRGPLTREQISSLMADRKQAKPTAAATETKHKESRSVHEKAASQRMILPPGVHEAFLKRRAGLDGDSKYVYKPALYGTAKVHFVEKPKSVDSWQDCAFILNLASDSMAMSWDNCRAVVGDSTTTLDEPDCPTAGYEGVPATFRQPKSFTTMRGQLKDHIYQSIRLTLRTCEPLALSAKLDETSEQFKARVAQAAKQKIAAEVKVLEDKHKQEIARLEEEKANAPSGLWNGFKRVCAWLGNVLLALLTVIPDLALKWLDMYANRGTSRRGGPRKAITARDRTRLASALRKSTSVRDDGPQERSQSDIEADIRQAEIDFEAESAAIGEKYDPTVLPINEISAAPIKGDIDVNDVKLVWLPFVAADDGQWQEAFDFQPNAAAKN